MQSINNKTIQIDGFDINVLTAGESTAATLLFLHGKAFQAQTWQELGTLTAVREKGFSVIALDLPGFGKSPESSLTPEQVINGVIQYTGCEKVILIGPSMGGKIAMEYALNNPGKIQGLVLIGTVGVAENRERLSQLPASTLIIWGENDQISDPQNGVELEQAIQGSTRIVFKGARHPCYLEQTELWHETLTKFVNSITGSHV